MQFRTVSKEEFFQYVGPRNVHPQCRPDKNVWIDQNTREVVGESTPGYLCVGEKSYKLVDKSAE